MKQKIRTNVFETNSSSTHSLSICTKEQFENFKEHNLYTDGEKFFTREEALKGFDEEYIEYYAKYNDYDKEDSRSVEDAKDNYLRDNSYQNYENLGYNEYETFEQEFTTPSGETVVAFGYYGNAY